MEDLVVISTMRRVRGHSRGPRRASMGTPQARPGPVREHPTAGRAPCREDASGGTGPSPGRGLHVTPDAGPRPVHRVGHPHDGLDRIPRGRGVPLAIDGEGVGRFRRPGRVGNNPNRVAAPIECDRDDGSNHHLHLGRLSCSRRGRGVRRRNNPHNRPGRDESQARSMDRGHRESDGQDEQRHRVLGAPAVMEGSTGS